MLKSKKFNLLLSSKKGTEVIYLADIPRRTYEKNPTQQK